MGRKNNCKKQEKKCEYFLRPQIILNTPPAVSIIGNNPMTPEAIFEPPISIDIETQPQPPTALSLTSQVQSMAPIYVDPNELYQFGLRLEQLLYNLRVSRGLVPLTGNAILRSVAQNHTQYMASTGQLVHSNNFGQVLINAGYNFRYAGENIAYATWPGNATAAANVIFNLWVNSPAHLANMVNPNFLDRGIGYVRYNNLVWSTLELGRRL